MILKDIFVPALFREWLEEKKGLASSSSSRYLTYVAMFFAEGNDPHNLDDYNKFIINKGIKNRATMPYSALRAFIKYYVEDVSLRNELLSNLVKPTIRTDKVKQAVSLSENDMLSMINYITEPKHKVMALIQFLTGVRSGDLFRMQRGSITPEIYNGKNVLKLTTQAKGNKKNIVYIHEEMTQEIIIDYVIRNYPSPNYYFLQETRGLKIESKLYELTLYRRRMYDKEIKHALSMIGFKGENFSTHDYRRNFARKVWTKYKDVHVLKELMNHQNPATTMRYLQTSGLQNIEHFKDLQS